MTGSICCTAKITQHCKSTIYFFLKKDGYNIESSKRRKKKQGEKPNG